MVYDFADICYAVYIFGLTYRIKQRLDFFNSLFQFNLINFRYFIFSGTTILDAITEIVDPSTEVVYSENPTTEFVKSNNFTYSIVVVGELPYAETAGDSRNLTITQSGIDTMSNVCGNTKCVVVLISGRPVVIEPYLGNIDALVAAWLPGSEGQGVADVLFGDYEFSGKLPRTWFKTVDQLPMNVGDKHYDPLYPYGFGLTKSKVQDQIASR